MSDLAVGVTRRDNSRVVRSRAVWLFKKSVRKEICQKRRAILPKESDWVAAKTLQKILALDLFQQSENVAVYCSMSGELPTQELITKIISLKKRCYLPVVRNINGVKELLFCAYRSGDILTKSEFGILEPESVVEKTLSPDNLDLVFLPLVAFDEKCHRIGMGGGYYDAAFAFKKTHAQFTKPYLVALAYEWQKIPVFKPDPWDVAVDLVITEKKIYHRP